MKSEFEVNFVEKIPKKQDKIILLCFEKKISELTNYLEKHLNKNEIAKIKDIIKKKNFKGEKSEKIICGGIDSADNVLIIGLGNIDNFKPFSLKEIFSNLIRQQKIYHENEICIMIENLKSNDLFKNFFTKNEIFFKKNILNQAKTKQIISKLTSEIEVEVALGCEIGNYNFEQYLSKKEEKKIKINIVTKEKNVKDIYQKEKYVIEGIFFTRNLSNQPSNILNPGEFAKICEKMKSLDIKIEVLDEEKMKKLGMNALLAVGQGSSQKSYAVIMKYENHKSKHFISLVGKGVTFDTGGISIKPSKNMEEMKFDMSGASTVCGIIKALAKRKSPVNVVGIIGLVENMPSGSAIKPGDIIKSMSGKTVEITNTDAEGRLVLIDLLTYIQKKFNSEYIIDLATLTGSITVALGELYAGIFTECEEIINEIAFQGNLLGENFWPMPMHSLYDQEMNSVFADMRNSEPGYKAGSITAAKFLQRVIDKKQKWAHIDIAGVASVSSNKFIKTAPIKGGATGFGVSTLVKWIEQHYDKN